MGEVYRAKDTRLGREVAVKVLPESLASDVERLRRFEKEAKSASALNHQNIVTIHDIGSESGVAYIAMELVDGATLRELLASGPLPIKKLLQIAPQVAEGLARAHEAGIVHRDLKPENVMVKKDGLVKILDFGLAKLTSTMSGSDEGSNLPTMTGTTPGVVVGTVGYMSPEQASAQSVDFRSDQFSFGSILYEMATGRRAFQKKTAIDTLGAILNDEPEPTASISPQTPAPLRWIIERCLVKEPEQRYDTTRDLARELANIRDHVSEAVSDRVVALETRKRLTMPRLGALAIALLLLAAGVAGDRWIRSRAATTAVPSFRQLTFHRGNVLTARFAPDGKTVAYSAAWDGQPSQVYTVRTDSAASNPIGLSNAEVLSVSPRGELAVTVAKSPIFKSGACGVLARMPLDGGTPRELLEGVCGADWAPNGEDLAVVRVIPDGRRRIEYPIGKALYEGDRIGDPIRVSPNGERVAFLEENNLIVMDRSGGRRRVADALYYFAWTPDSEEVLVSGNVSPGAPALRAVSPSGRVRVLLPAALQMAIHDVASDGRLLVEDGQERCGIMCLPKGETHERELGWMFYTFIAKISDDGTSLVCFQSEEAGDPNGVYLRKTDGSPPVRLGEGAIQDYSSDGRWVLAFSGSPRQLTMIPTGPGASKKIPIDGSVPRYARLLPNSKGFLLVSADAGGDSHVSVLGPDGGKPSAVRAEELAGNSNLAASPDGTRFVYAGKDSRLRVATIGTGLISLVPGDPLQGEDHILAWTIDGYVVLAAGSFSVPGRIDRVELGSGRREPWKRLIPEDPIGVTQVWPFAFSRDGHSYAYSYVRSFVDDLYVVDGVALNQR